MTLSSEGRMQPTPSGPAAPAESRALGRVVTLRLLTWTGVAATLPFILALGYLSDRVMLVAFLVWVGIVAIPATMLKWSSCPSCRQFLFIPVHGDRRRRATALTARDRANCGMPL